MRVRWPFLLALAVLLLGIGAWATAPAVSNTWHQRQADREAAAAVARITPAWRVLSTMPAPVGLTANSFNRSRELTPMLLWRGNTGSHLAALRFRSALVAAGATHAEVRCRGPLGAQRHTFCRVDAVLAGLAITANVGPGLRASGGLDDDAARVGVDLLGPSPPVAGVWARVPVE